MKILIIPMSYVTGGSPISTRYRCKNLVRNSGDFTEYNGTQNIDDYDAIIFQKANNEITWKISEKYKNSKILILDLADPIYLSSFYHCCGKDKCCDYINDIILNMDCIVVNSWGMYKDCYLLYNKPVYFIEDYYDFSLYKNIPKYHTEDKKNLKIIYFGLAETFSRHLSCLKLITQYNCSLIFFSNKDLGYGKFIPYSEDIFTETLLSCDLSVSYFDTINNRKSNSKCCVSWIFGLPCITSDSDFVRFLDYNERIKESEYRFNYVRKYYDIQIACNLYKEVITNMYARKNLLKEKNKGELYM